MNMPTYDKVLLTEQARGFGFQTAAFEKVCRLAEILRFLNKTDELRKVLALKGGTSINLAVFNLPRLSVDIDLDFTENLTREETRARRDRIGDLLGRYLTAEGYRPKEKTKRTHILDSFVYAYTNVAGNSDNIKIEINYSMRCHALPTLNMVTRMPDVFVSFPVRVLAPAEIFASKIVVLSDRAAARDLYDLNNMVYYGLFDEADIAMLRKCAALYLAVAGDSAARGFRFERIADITPYKIRTDLFPMIRSAERFDLRAAQERVANFLNERMKPTDRESAFLESFAAGRYEPGLLFEDEEILKRIEGHPMAAWRIAHIRQEQQRER
jgi:predicted nucleotidyltransferase component of viral defense system